MVKINFNENIPSHYAFTVLLIVSFLTAWYVISVADKIVSDLPDSKTLNLPKDNYQN